MQVVTDIFKFLFFPGLLFMVFCGSVIAFLEGRVKTVIYGGEGPSLPPITSGGLVGEGLSMGELLLLILPLSAMGIAGILLVGIKGDLLVLVLLLSAVELLPLSAVVRAGGEGLGYTPLAFRLGFVRLLTVFCVVVTVSLRFSGEFTAALDSFKSEGAFSVLQVWDGLGFGLMLAALVCAAAAIFIYLVGRPSWELLEERETRGTLRGILLLTTRWAELAVIIILSVVVFLGYPWEGRTRLIIWSGAALGIAVAVIVARAWAEGRTPATLRRWQQAGCVLALLSLALALAAAW
jgi:hypothetical protein